MWHNMIDEIKEGLWGLSIPTIRITDIIEIFIIAVIVYKILVWIKNTKAWMLLKGIMHWQFLF